MSELNDKQRLFALEYMVDLNATQAAIRAGYSEKTARQQGSRLLSFVNVQAVIEERARELCEELGVAAEDVIRGLSCIATYDVGELIHPETRNPMAVRDIPEPVRRVIASIKYSKITTVTERRTEEGDVEVTETVHTQVVEIKMPDRLRAYELLGRHLSLFDQDRAPPQETATLIIDGLRVTGGKRYEPDKLRVTRQRPVPVKEEITHQ